MKLKAMLGAAVLGALLCLGILAPEAQAQGVIQQAGPVTPGHAVCFLQNGIAQDCGSATSPVTNSFGVAANGGQPLCVVTTSGTLPTGQLCLAVSPSAGGSVNFTTSGALPLIMTVNGTTVFNSATAGSLPSLANGDIWIGNGSNVATANAVSGDGVLGATGILTVTKSNGVAFGTAAFKNTTNNTGAVAATSGAFTTGHCLQAGDSAGSVADSGANCPSLTLPLSVANGGTNASLTASNGGILYSGASAFAVLAGTSTAGLPLVSGDDTTPSWATKSGSTTDFATTTGTLTNGHCVSIDANANFIDAGGACTTGGGGGTVSSATGGQLTYYASSGTTVAGNANLTVSTGTLSLGQSASVAGALKMFGSSSGSATIQASSAAGSTTITVPATTGNMVTTGDSGTVTNTMLANASTTVAGQLCTLGSTCAPAVTGLANIAGGTVVGNATGSSAAPGATAHPVLGIPTGSTGEIGLAGATSGTATITAQATSGSPTLTLPNTTGTLVSTAASPLSISATTGQVSIATATASQLGAVQGDGSTITITGGVAACTTATTSQLGCVKPDGSTITITGGVISSTNSGGPVLLNTLVASNSASLIDTTSLTGSYKSYEFRLINIVPASAEYSFMMLFSTNGGSSYDTNVGNYNWVLTSNLNGSVEGSSGSNQYFAGGGIGLSNNASYGGLSGQLYLFNPGLSGTYKSMTLNLTSTTTPSTTSGLVFAQGSVTYSGSTSAINAVKFTMSSGNITSGSIEIWGYP